MEEKHNKFGLFAASFVILGAISMTLFRHWEPSGETWGYWLFARIFSQTGRFIITDRSPIYILYLNIFRGLGYPAAVIVEYIVTFLIVAAALVIFFRQYLGLFWATFALLLWIPFLQVAEPPVQKLALACSCLAILLRDRKINRFRLAISYALLGIAYMLRSSYIIFIFVFAVGDIVRVIRQNNFRSFFAKLRLRRQDWPALFVLTLLVWFITMQSPHSWNNGWFVSTKWFPSKGKKVADAAFIQGSNWYYIFDKYGTFKDKDFYFTNQEAFGGAKDMIGVIRANPRFAAVQFARKIKKTFCTISSFTKLPPFLYEKVSALGYFHYVIFLFFIVPFVLAILYGALRACKSKTMVLFVIANIFLIAATTIFTLKERYMHPFIPLLILSAFWYGRQICNILKEKRLLSRLTPRVSSTICFFVMFFSFIFFSNSLSSWAKIGGEVVADINKDEIKVMERRDYSCKVSFNSLKLLIRNCQGVISLEHKFIGAFTEIPLSKVYDVWEIPPFGHFGSSQYEGLRPDRIDCILVSQELATGIGCATNYQLRYQNYIKPYTKYLKRRGAKTYEIEKFGHLIKGEKNERNIPK